jgi:ABC-type hemin transport system substrate-binding protein
VSERFTDALGQRFERARDARIVSLVPSITETLVDLGLRGQLVGRTGFCVHPREIVREVAKVGGTKDVKLDAVRALRPTHAIVNVDENEAPPRRCARGCRRSSRRCAEPTGRSRPCCT